MAKPYNRPARPWDLFNPNIEKVSDDVSDSRMSICKQCPELIKTTSQCKKCGCIMNLKTKLPNASCPLNKWGQVQNVK
jgi:hypothetical protein